MTQSAPSQPATPAPVMMATPPVATRSSKMTLVQRILRGIQFCFAVIVLGTVGAVVSSDSRIEGCRYTSTYTYTCFYTPQSFNYAIFSAVWTLLVSTYFFVSTYKPKIYHVIPAIVLDALSIIIWFASFISLAVWIGSYSYIYNRVATDSGYSALSAGTAFGAFTWVSFVATLVLTVVAFIRSRRSNANVAPAPEMAQHV